MIFHRLCYGKKHFKNILNIDLIVFVLLQLVNNRGCWDQEVSRVKYETEERWFVHRDLRRYCRSPISRWRCTTQDARVALSQHPWFLIAKFRFCIFKVFASHLLWVLEDSIIWEEQLLWQYLLPHEISIATAQIRTIAAISLC